MLKLKFRWYKRVNDDTLYEFPEDAKPTLKIPTLNTRYKSGTYSGDQAGIVFSELGSISESNISSFFRIDENLQIYSQLYPDKKTFYTYNYMTAEYREPSSFGGRYVEPKWVRPFDYENHPENHDYIQGIFLAPDSIFAPKYTNYGLAIGNNGNLIWCAWTLENGRITQLKLFIDDREFPFIGTDSPAQAFLQMFDYNYPASEDSEAEGGFGDLDSESDHIPVPDLPTMSAVSSGMVKLYAPTSERLAQFSDYLWSKDIFTNFSKLFQDPIEAVLNLSIIPIKFPVGGEQPIKVGNLSSTVSASTITKQFVRLNLGNLNLNEYWGNFLDYQSTSISIYLPFIGVRELNVKDCMSGNLSLTYKVDLLSGLCLAQIYIERGNLNSVLYEYTGNCAYQIPLTASNFSNTLLSLANLGAQLGIATATGNPAMAVAAGLTVAGGVQSHVQKTSGENLNAGYFGVWTPYLIIERPIQAIPGNYAELTGYTSYVTDLIGNQKGYTEVDSVHLDGIQATDSELLELESILKGGFII